MFSKQALPQGNTMRMLFDCSTYVLFVTPPVMYHFIDCAPIGQTTHIAIVNIEICPDFPTGRRWICWQGFIWVIGIDSIKFQSAFTTEFHSFFQ